MCVIARLNGRRRAFLDSQPSARGCHRSCGQRSPSPPSGSSRAGTGERSAAVRTRVSERRRAPGQPDGRANQHARDDLLMLYEQVSLAITCKDCPPTLDAPEGPWGRPSFLRQRRSGLKAARPRDNSRTTAAPPTTPSSTMTPLRQNMRRRCERPSRAAMGWTRWARRPGGR